ncbi:MAG: ABC transporter ATP-binding protein [Thermoprotei archaeon]
MDAIRVKGLSVYYRTPLGQVKVLDSVDATFEEGKTVGVVGESGSGKSTLGFAITRLLPPTGIAKGSIRYYDTELLSLPAKKMREVRGTGIFMIMQDPFSSLNPVKRIKDQLMEALLVKYERRKETLDPKSGEKEILKRLSDVKLPDPDLVMLKYPHQLSGGQIQRIVIAMGLLLEPKIMIADEPTSALDVSIQAQVIALMKELQQNYGMTLIFVTHDLAVASAVSDKVLILYAGRTMEFGDVGETIKQPLHPYTQGLLKSFPSGSYKEGRLFSLKGMPPSFFDMPAGCRFNPRCPYAFDRCFKEEPGVYGVGDRLVRCFLYDKSNKS